MMNWNANWIWYPGMQRKPNFYFYARKNFLIPENPLRAELHISAYTDYILYINGEYLGRGPNPSLLAYPFYDSYDILPYLRPGKNVIAVLAHNYAVGLHWIPMGPGGLIMQADLQFENQVQQIITDESWRVNPARCYDLRSPRMMWSCQYLETFHYDQYDPDWAIVDFDDSRWAEPQVLGRPPVWPWVRLIPREIPFLQEIRKKPVQCEKGSFQVSGFHALTFQAVEEAGKNRLYYAQTFFFCDVVGGMAQKAALNVSCDDAFKVFLNGAAILEQSYDEKFVREQQWVGQEDFDQVHNSVGPRRETASISLQPGWNKLVVVVDQGPEGWGFGLGIVEGDHGKMGRWDVLNFDRFQDLRFSSQAGKDDSLWQLHGPFESSGFKNSLDIVRDDHIPTGGKQALYDPHNLLILTDYDLLMRSEVRQDFSTLETGDRISLKAGECLVLDMGQVVVGNPILEVETAAEAVLDIGCGNVLSSGHNLSYMFQVRCVDRVTFTSGTHFWQAITRREGRYVHISCRKGESVQIKAPGMVSIQYPIDQAASFACSDAQLTKIWQASLLNTQLIMQDSFQDCIRREGGLHNSRSMLHAFPGAFLSYGDVQLIKKTIREEIRTQEPTGWWSGEGPTDNGWDEPTKAMWTIELIDLYYQYTGDPGFLNEIYENLRCFLRYYTRLENKHILLDTRNEYRDLPGRTIYIDDGLIHPPYNLTSDVVLLGYNIVYYAVLSSMAHIAMAIGRLEDASAYRKRAGFVKEACNTLFWDAEKEIFVEWYKEGEKSDGCPVEVLVLGLYYRIYDDEKTKKVVDFLFNKPLGVLQDFETYSYTFGFYYFILELFFRYGLAAKAYDLLNSFYGSWLQMNMTTMGEHFTLKEYRAVKDKGSLGRDYNVHGYGTSALPHFYSNILGIQILESGMKRILVSPQPGDLEWAEGSVFTPQGKLRVHWRQSEGHFGLDIEAPERCQVEVQTPKGLIQVVHVIRY